MKPIEKAVQLCGSQKALAKKIDVTPVFVSQMVTGAKSIPARLCLPIENATENRVTRYELRPDIFGSASTDVREVG